VPSTEQVQPSRSLPVPRLVETMCSSRESSAARLTWMFGLPGSAPAPQSRPGYRGRHSDLMWFIPVDRPTHRLAQRSHSAGKSRSQTATRLERSRRRCACTPALHGSPRRCAGMLSADRRLTTLPAWREAGPPSHGVLLNSQDCRRQPPTTCRRSADPVPVSYFRTTSARGRHLIHHGHAGQRTAARKCWRVPVF